MVIMNSNSISSANNILVAEYDDDTSENHYSYDDVSYDYDDGFEDVEEEEYYEIFINQPTNVSNLHADEEEEEDIFEDDEEEQKISYDEIRAKIAHEKALKQLQNFNLGDKLRWCSVSIEPVESDLDENVFPKLSTTKHPPKEKANYKANFKATTNIGIYHYRWPATRCYFGFALNKIKRRDCRWGMNCKNSRCTFTHPKNFVRPANKNGIWCDTSVPPPSDDTWAESSTGVGVFLYDASVAPPVVPAPTHDIPEEGWNPAVKQKPKNKSPPEAIKPKVDKKIFLCKNVYVVENGKIITNNNCKFNSNCVFSHSWTEIRNLIAKNESYLCSFKEKCNGVTYEFISKPDSAGVTRQVRKYKNSDTRKCYKLHVNEKIQDYIIRTQT